MQSSRSIGHSTEDAQTPEHAEAPRQYVREVVQHVFGEERARHLTQDAIDHVWESLRAILVDLSPPGVEMRSGTTESPIRNAFATRFGGVVRHLAEAADERSLAEALAVADPVSGLAVALEHAASLEPPRDPLAAARARGAAGRERLMQRAGGLLRVGDVARALDVTPQAVQGRRSRGTILAVMAANGEWRYPACQFADEGVLPELGTVLAAFKDVEPWQQLAVLLAPSARFGERSALELLAAGEVDAARSIAATYGEHG